MGPWITDWEEKIILQKEFIEVVARNENIFEDKPGRLQMVFTFDQTALMWNV